MTPDQAGENILLGSWTEEGIDALLRKSRNIGNPGRRIDFLSQQFLNKDYKENTLTGSARTPEVFVINLRELDCFTYLEYVEAMRSSVSFDEFKDTLIHLRYGSDTVSFESRNHFFTDWCYARAGFLEDMTAYISQGKAKTVLKSMNRKKDGTLYLPGIPVFEREITYIPSDAALETAVDKMKTGDYIGIYSKKEGLDVSHVGIAVKKNNALYFRHASSSEHCRRVVDQDFASYLRGKPGIIVLRPKD